MSLGNYFLSTLVHPQLRLVWKDRRHLVPSHGEIDVLLEQGNKVKVLSSFNSDCKKGARWRNDDTRDTVTGCGFAWRSLTEAAPGRWIRFYSVKGGVKLCHSIQSSIVEIKRNKDPHSCRKQKAAADAAAPKSGFAAAAPSPSDAAYEAVIKTNWLRLYAIGGVGLFVGWHSEHFWEDACSHYTPESVLCVNIIDGEKSVVEQQKPEHKPAVVDRVIMLDRSCSASSNGKLNSCNDSSRSKCKIRNVAAPPNNCSTHDRSCCIHTCKSSNDNGATSPHYISSAAVEDEIICWQDFASTRPGFISSRVYVQLYPRPLPPHPALAATSDIEWLAALRAEKRRYLLLDRWASRQDAEVNCVSDQGSDNGSSSGKKHKQYKEGNGILGDCQGTLYFFDSHQAAPLWKLFLPDAVGDIFRSYIITRGAETRQGDGI